MGLLLTARKPTESNTLISIYIYVLTYMHVVFCNTSPLDGNICKVAKLCTFAFLSQCIMLPLLLPVHTGIYNC